jgi:uncharacterized protein with gpF-like domain
VLLNVSDDDHFQAYLDREEQRLYVPMAGILTAGVRLQVNRNAVAAEVYIVERGGPLLFKTYRRIYRDQFRAVGAQLVERKAEEGSAGDFMDEQLRYLKAEAGRKIVEISETLREFVRGIVMGMVQDGKSSEAIARELNQQAPEIGRTRAATIARTETHQAALAAIDETLKYKTITVRTKQWWTAGDLRVRKSHKNVDGQTKPYDEPFKVGNSLMMRPGDGSLGAGPEELCNCRCSILYLTEDRVIPGAADSPMPE